MRYFIEQDKDDNLNKLTIYDDNDKIVDSVYVSDNDLWNTEALKITLYITAFKLTKYQCYLVGEQIAHDKRCNQVAIKRNRKI